MLISLSFLLLFSLLQLFKFISNQMIYPNIRGELFCVKGFGPIQRFNPLLFWLSKFQIEIQALRPIIKELNMLNHWMKNHKLFYYGK